MNRIGTRLSFSSKSLSLLIAATQLLALSAQAVPQPARVVSVALDTEPPQLDTTKMTDTESGFIIGHIMEGLTRLDKSGKTVPGVAEKWTINDRGATFHLRKNAKWSDGKPVTA